MSYKREWILKPIKYFGKVENIMSLVNKDYEGVNLNSIAIVEIIFKIMNGIIVYGTREQNTYNFGRDKRLNS